MAVVPIYYYCIFHAEKLCCSVDVCKIKFNCVLENNNMPCRGIQFNNESLQNFSNDDAAFGGACTRFFKVAIDTVDA